MRQRTSSLSMAFLALISSFILAISLTTPANSDPAPKPEFPSASLAPTAYEQWANAAEELVERFRNESARDPSFAEVAIDVPKRSVLIYRKSKTPSALYSVGAHPSGINVEFRSAPMTKSQTDKLMAAIWRRRKILAQQNIRIEAVNTSWAGPVTIEVRHHTSSISRKLKAQFSYYGPNTVRTQEAQDVVSLARDFDTSPFYGGAHINSARGRDAARLSRVQACTTGFTGRSKTNGAHYVITADHCVKIKDPRFWTSNARLKIGGGLVGTVTVRDSKHDIAFIKVTRNKSASPRIWDGPIKPKNRQFSKKVTKMVRPTTGARVCASGAFAGARCYATVTGVSLRRTSGVGGDFSYSRDVYLWGARMNNGSAIACHGDSGGPVIIPHGSTVTAVGSIATGTHQVSNVGEGHGCFRDLWFTDVYSWVWRSRSIDLTR